MNFMIPERITFIEVGRILSIFLVVLLHGCLGSYYLFASQHDINWYAALFYYTFSRISVPIFVMISGMSTIWLKKKYGKDVTIRDALFRIKKIIIPIIIWSIIYLALLNQLSISSILNILWSPQGLVHLWFLYMLIGLYLLSPFVFLLFDFNKFDLIKYILIVWFVFSSLNVYFQALFSINLGEWFGLFTNYQSGFLGYYILGAYIMMNPAPSLYKSLSLTVLGFILSYALVVWDNHGASVFNDRFLNFLAPNVVLMSFGAISVLRSLDFSWFKHSYMVYISPLVIGVYLTHEMILKFFREYFGLVGYGYNSIYFLPLLAVAVFIISLAISYILSKAQGKHKLFF